MAFTYTTSTQASGFTLAQLITFIDTTMVTDLGYTLLDSYVSTDEYRVYSYTYNGTAKGTFILRIQYTATQLNIVQYDAWNAGTHTGTGATTTTTLGWSNSTSAVVDKFIGAEGRFAMLSNNSSRVALGYLRPSTPSTTTWPESTYRHLYYPSSSNFSTLYVSAGAAGIASVTINTLNLSSVAAATWAGSKRQVWGPKFVMSASTGPVGFFTDIAETGLSGIAYGDIIQVSVGAEEYFVIGASGSSNVVRII